MPDRRLIGLLAIALVVSTILVGVMFSVEPEDDIQFLASRMPKVIRCSEQAERTHSVDFMVTRETPLAIVRCMMLVKRPDLPREQSWTDMGLEAREKIESFLTQFEERLSISPIYRRYLIEDASGLKYEVMDISRTLEALGGSNALGNCFSVYAFREDANGDISFYRGKRDFFFNGDKTLKKIEYSYSGKTRTYVSGLDNEGTEMPMAQAPPGRIKIGNMTSGDRFHLEVVFDTQNFPPYAIISETPYCHKGTMRIITIQTGEEDPAIKIDFTEPD